MGGNESQVGRAERASITCPFAKPPWGKEHNYALQRTAPRAAAERER